MKHTLTECTRSVIDNDVEKSDNAEAPKDGAVDHSNAAQSGHSLRDAPVLSGKTGYFPRLQRLNGTLAAARK